jgi:CRP-like cAMP-binding protein
VRRGRRDAKLEALASVPLFSGLARRDLSQIATIADEVDVPAGKTLITEGTPGRQFVVLLEGQVDVRRGRRKLNTLGPGDFFGEISLLSKRPATATVTTVEPSLVAVMTPRNFTQLLRRSPRIQLKVLQALAERVPYS